MKRARTFFYVLVFLGNTQCRPSGRSAQKILPESNESSQQCVEGCTLASPAPWYDMDGNLYFWPTGGDFIDKRVSHNGLHVLNLALLEGIKRFQLHFAGGFPEMSQLQPILLWLVPSDYAESHLVQATRVLQATNNIARARYVGKSLSWRQLGNMHCLLAKTDRPCQIQVVQAPHEGALRLSWVYDLAKVTDSPQKVISHWLENCMPRFTKSELVGRSVLIRYDGQDASVKNFLEPYRRLVQYRVARGYLRSMIGPNDRRRGFEMCNLGKIVAKYLHEPVVFCRGHLNYQPLLRVHSASELYRSAYYAALLSPQAIASLYPSSHGKFQCMDDLSYRFLCVSARIPWAPKKTGANCSPYQCGVCNNLLVSDRGVVKLKGCQHRFCRQCLAVTFEFVSRVKQAAICPACGRSAMCSAPIPDSTGSEEHKAIMYYPACFLEEAQRDMVGGRMESRKSQVVTREYYVLERHMG